jgi:hypothetical protein
MTEPIPTHYQNPADVWHPHVNIKGKNLFNDETSDELKAVLDYDKIYGGAPNQITFNGPDDSEGAPWGSYDVPTLSSAYTDAPDFIAVENKPDATAVSPTSILPPFPNFDTGSGKNGPGAGSNLASTTKSFVPIQDIFANLYELRTVESTLLHQNQVAIGNFTNLKQLVQSVTNNTVDAFGQFVGRGQWYGGPSSDGNNQYTDDQGIAIHYDMNWDQLDSGGKDFAAHIEPQMEYLLQIIGNAIETLGTFTALLNNAGQMYTESDSHSAFPTPDGL